MSWDSVDPHLLGFRCGLLSRLCHVRRPDFLGVLCLGYRQRLDLFRLWLGFDSGSGSGTLTMPYDSLLSRSPWITRAEISRRLVLRAQRA